MWPGFVQLRPPPHPCFESDTLPTTQAGAACGDAALMWHRVLHSWVFEWSLIGCGSLCLSHSKTVPFLGLQAAHFQIVGIVVGIVPGDGALPLHLISAMHSGNLDFSHPFQSLPRNWTHSRVPLKVNPEEVQGVSRLSHIHSRLHQLHLGPNT